MFSGSVIMKHIYASCWGLGSQTNEFDDFRGKIKCKICLSALSFNIGNQEFVNKIDRKFLISKIGRPFLYQIIISSSFHLDKIS